MPTYDSTYYNNGGSLGGYDAYGENTYANETAVQLAQKFFDISGVNGIQLTSKKVLIIGCAYGYTVKYLVQNHGVNCFGMDISSYAISQAPSDVASRLLVGDCRVQADWLAARTLAGLTKPNDKFDVVIDEDMLCCLTDGDAQTFRTYAMNYGNFFIHLLDNSPNLATWYNFKTITQWKALLGTSPKEKWYTRFYWLES